MASSWAEENCCKDTKVGQPGSADKVDGAEEDRLYFTRDVIIAGKMMPVFESLNLLDNLIVVSNPPSQLRSSGMAIGQLDFSSPIHPPRDVIGPGAVVVQSKSVVDAGVAEFSCSQTRLHALGGERASERRYLTELNAVQTAVLDPSVIFE
uniref:Uncharacterized protein n=1 Tax=Coccidioides posadasii RMSCC 3488 TaxID=454284 RepID=A0A0J6FII8_COCPO|nr:hypothetical protein CPAG_06410 [Coccidioides posadasii RMSCC 3488]